MKSSSDKKDETESEKNIDIYEESLKYKELNSYIKEGEGRISTSDLEVYLKWKAHKRIIGYAIRYANEGIPKEEWREVYGILIGNTIIKKKNIVQIIDAIPMVVGGRAGVKFEDKQYVDLAQIDASVYERSIKDKKRDFVIGWWHSHPGFGFFFSSVDALTQLGYQLPNNYAVGLIFDHTKLKDKSMGIKALRLKDPQRGVQSTYDYIDLRFENNNIKDHLEITKIILNENNNFKSIFTYLREHLSKGGFIQLRKQFGLIPYATNNGEDNLNLDEIHRYRWSERDTEKDFKIPEFRKKLEKNLTKFKKEIIELKTEGNKQEYKKKQKKYSNQIKSDLEKANELFTKINEDFNKQLGNLKSSHRYLDTSERKLIENIQNRLQTYKNILDDFFIKSNLDID
jgi:26S proteasome regulatory subunit N11